MLKKNFIDILSSARFKLIHNEFDTLSCQKNWLQMIVYAFLKTHSNVKKKQKQKTNKQKM